MEKIPPPFSGKYYANIKFFFLTWKKGTAYNIRQKNFSLREAAKERLSL